MTDAGQSDTRPRAREITISETSEHIVRNSMAARQRTWTLGPGALQWREDGKQGEIPYGGITQMRLMSYASYGGAQYQCVLTMRPGGREKIRSHHYKGLGNFEDRTMSYAPVMRELAARIAASAPDAKFVAGSTGMWWLWLIVSILWAGIVIVIVAMLASGVSLSGNLWPIFLAIIVGPLAWRQLRQGQAKTFDPQDPPANLLGG